MVPIGTIIQMAYERVTLICH